MPASYRIRADLGLVQVRYAGHVTLQDTRDLLARFLQDPLNRPGLRQLIDLFGVTVFERDLVGLMALAPRKDRGSGG